MKRQRTLYEKFETTFHVVFVSMFAVFFVKIFLPGFENYINQMFPVTDKHFGGVSEQIIVVETNPTHVHQSLNIDTSTEPYILFTGGISRTSFSNLSETFEERSHIKRIHFYSLGGDLLSIPIFVDFFRDNDLTMVLIEDAVCLSACASIATALLQSGNLEYKKGAIVAFHMPSVIMDHGNIPPRIGNGISIETGVRFSKQLVQYGMGWEALKQIMDSTSFTDNFIAPNEDNRTLDGFSDFVQKGRPLQVFSSTELREKYANATTKAVRKSQRLQSAK